jgi:GTPase SAR1 family protein
MERFSSERSLTSQNAHLQNMKEFKIAVLGRSLVGKSALTFRFINDKFPTEHDTTIEDQYRIDMIIDGYDCRLGNINLI